VVTGRRVAVGDVGDFAVEVVAVVAAVGLLVVGLGGPVPADVPSAEGTHDGKLATDTTSNGTTSYLYDADGNLLLQKDPGQTTAYLFGGAQQLVLNTGTSAVTGTRFLSLPGGGVAVRTGAGTAYSFEVTDQHGTSLLTLDSTAANPAWRQYTPYGAPRGQAPSSWPDANAFLGKPADTATSLDIIGARQYNPATGRFLSVDPILELGNSKEAKDAIFRLRQDELGLPIRTDRGYLVLSVKQIQPAHPGSLEEVRDKIITELKQQKSTELARTKAEDLAKRVKSGEKFEVAAKSLGLEAKTSDLLARNGSISGAVSGKQVGAAFQLKPGDVGAPLNVGANWFVYRVAEKQEPNPADFEKQKKELTDQVLQTKRNIAFEAFRTSLEARLRQEGKLQIMPDKLKGLGDLS